MDHRPKFAAKDRERIRRSLLAYKLKFGIGAPRFAILISEASPRKPHVDHRRVARFLAQQTVPEDDFLGWCETFLQTVPEEKDAVWQLGQGLRAFCALQPGAELAGQFSLDSVSYPDDRPDVGLTAEFSIEPDDGFYRVEERVAEPHQISDGAMVATPTGGLALLADRLTLAVKCYVLNGADEAFSINALEPLSKTFADSYHMQMARVHGRTEV